MVGNYQLCFLTRGMNFNGVEFALTTVGQHEKSEQLMKVSAICLLAGICID